MKHNGEYFTKNGVSYIESFQNGKFNGLKNEIEYNGISITK